jgi:hypothetical protein
MFLENNAFPIPYGTFSPILSEALPIWLSSGLTVVDGTDGTDDTDGIDGVDSVDSVDGVYGVYGVYELIELSVDAILNELGVVSIEAWLGILIT